MPRKTDTYARVLEIAARWTAEGRILEQTAIRKEIGYGSYSTINRALTDWRAQGDETSSRRTGASTLTPPTAPSVDRELLDSLLQIQRALASLQPMPGAASGKGDFSEIAGRLDALAQRFDGTQRHMLLQIEEARTHAARWKEKWETAQQETRTWRDAVQAQQASLARLREELAWLRGSAGQPIPAAPSKPTGNATASTAPAAAPAPLRYPGHPRPVPQPSDEDTFE